VNFHVSHGPDLENLPQHDEPTIYPDVQVARRYRYHILVLPGDDKPRWFLRLNQALATASMLGFDYVLLSIDEPIGFVRIHLAEK